MPETASPPTGSLATALRHAVRLLASRPDLAEAQAREILMVVPGNAQASLVLGQACAAQDNWQAARDILGTLCRSQTQDAAAHAELGTVLIRLGDTIGAIAALERAVALSPKLAGAWRDLGDQRLLAGDTKGAEHAYARHILASVNDPHLLEAARALCDNRLAVAERLLRDFLKQHPTDVAAIRMLAETGSRLGRYEDAERLLERCLELAPNFRMARQNYATVLYRQNKAADALAAAERLLEEEPGNAGVRALKAAALGQIGEYGKAVENYEQLLKEQPAQPKAWMSYGHALKALGRQNDCIAAYRRSVALLQSLGEAWWSLANLKTLQFTRDDIAAMQMQLARPELNDEDRWHLHFALGKALEDEESYSCSFEHYREGNRLCRLALDYDPGEITNHVNRSCAFFTRAFFEARSGWGSPAPDPIFVVGLPRAGSTLVEQILASHVLVEGTMELPDIISTARRLGGKMKRSDRSDYPEVLANLDSNAVRELGEEYLARTRIHRRLARPFFIDKMPNNFAHTGLIHLILPNAKIIDVRRHPMACGFSLYKQHFARGQGFSYDLDDIARYYTDYVNLMAHFDAVLPGRIHRVFYEMLIADFEGEVRRLLAYCALPFEERCLKFHENARPVRTASSEQVRQPIFTDGIERWRHYETWLEPLKSGLAHVLSDYPAQQRFR